MREDGELEDFPSNDGGGDDPAVQRIAELLADLADDPAAPPSTVTPASIIAAARAADAHGDNKPARGDIIPAHGDRSAGKPSNPGLRLVAGGGPGSSRRRAGLIALVAAASMAGIAAVIIPLTLTDGTSTTSAERAREAVAASAPPAEVPAPAMAASQPPNAADLSAAAPSAADSGGAAGGDSAGGNPASGNAESQAEAGALASAADCWPALSPAAAAALSESLPAGSFGPARPLDGDCGPDPVAGAILLGTNAGTELVVRVSNAGTGACADTSGEAGSRCAPAGDGSYVGSDPAGPAVYAYGGGYEVALGGAARAGVPASPTGLSTEQLQAAAAALLGAL